MPALGLLVTPVAARLGAPAAIAASLAEVDGRPSRRAICLVLAAVALGGCAGLGLREPLRVSLAGLEPLPGKGMEIRFLASLRVQNPNDAAIAYDGLSVEVDLNGRSFASGVADAAGDIPRFGERVVELPVTVPATSILRQVVGVFTGDRGKATYRIRGFLNTGTVGRAPFDSTGEIELSRSTGN